MIVGGYDPIRAIDGESFVGLGFGIHGLEDELIWKLLQLQLLPDLES